MCCNRSQNLLDISQKKEWLTKECLNSLLGFFFFFLQLFSKGIFCLLRPWQSAMSDLNGDLNDHLHSFGKIFFMMSFLSALRVTTGAVPHFRFFHIFTSAGSLEHFLEQSSFIQIINITTHLQASGHCKERCFSSFDITAANSLCSDDLMVK